MAPLLALHFHGELIKDTSVTFFIGNLGVLSGLTVGSSTVADLGTVLHGATLHAARLNVLVWWEHVDSAANPSDGGAYYFSPPGVLASLLPTAPLVSPLDHWGLWNPVPSPPCWPPPLLRVYVQNCELERNGLQAVEWVYHAKWQEV